MSRPTRICKICGKEYAYCMPTRPSDNPFRWQDVACCKEHGMKYFELVLKDRARTESKPQNEEAKAPAENIDPEQNKSEPTRKPKKEPAKKVQTKKEDIKEHIPE